MSHSTCAECGGHVDLGPEASNRCQECGSPFWVLPTDPGIEALRRLQEQIHATAKEKGWWDRPVEPGAFAANLHGEVSEYWECVRANEPRSDHIPTFLGSEEELADVIIRILDYAEGVNLDVLGAMIAKMQYNKGREYRHGGKAF